MRQPVVSTLAAAALALAGCSPGVAPPRNVIVLLVDTLRADHLSLYGASRDTSPNLDRRADSAVVFEQARSQSSCTDSSVASLLTSRYPQEFLGQKGGRMGIPARIPSLAGELARHGFATWAVSASPVVRKTGSRFNWFGGFGGGFQVFHEECDWKSASCVNEAALGLLEQTPDRFLLYLHYMDPHSPYQPPPGHRPRFADGYVSASPYINAGDGFPLNQSLHGESPPIPWTLRDVEHLDRLYDEEIAYLDDELERFFRELGRRGILDDTLVVLLADHGENLLLEHFDLQHCRNVWEESIHTPLVFWIPGRERGSRVATHVENLDLMPTILDLLGIRDVPAGMRGRSLRPEIEGRSGAERLGFALQHRWRAVVDRRYKLIVDLEAQRERLFDLAADPREQYDLAGERPAEARRLKAALLSWVESEEGADVAESLRKARANLDELRATGYL